MFKAFQNLFSFGDTNETVALIVLLLISFLLGLLFWALFVHFPKSRRLKKENKELLDKANRLEKEHKDISERYAVQGAKLKRLEEDYATIKSNLEEKNERINQQDNTINGLNQSLKDARQYAQERKEELDELKRQRKFIMEDSRENADKADRALLAQKQALRKVEEMKGLIEEVESEKQKTVKEAIALEQKHAQLLKDLRNSQRTIEMLQTDLNGAMEEINALTKHNQEIKASLGETGASSQNLKVAQLEQEEENRGLQKRLKALESQLAVYLDAEEAERKMQADEDEMMENALQATLWHLNTEPFYAGFEEANEHHEYIENERALEDALNADEQDMINSRSLDIEKEVIELDDDEHDNFEHTLSMVNEAMGMQGLYNDIDAAILTEQELIEGEQLTDDELMERTLKNTEELLEQSDLFMPLLGTDDLVEDEETMNSRFLQDEEEMAMQARNMVANVKEVIDINDDEHTEMDRALETALNAINMEGLYAPIDAQQLLDASNEDLEEIDPKYRSDIERAVVQEIGDRIPIASEEEKDDLKKIEGIGMFIEQKLNFLGIYTYKQITYFDEAFIEKLTPAIGFSEKAIQHNRWIEQAQALLSAQEGQ